MENKIAEIVITGEHNQPHNIPLSELREFLEAIEDLYSSLSTVVNPSLKLKDFKLSLIGLEKGSTRLSLASNKYDEALNVSKKAIMAIHTGDFSKIPLKTLRQIEKLRELASTRNCDIEFYQPDPESKIVARITPQLSIETSKFTIQSETTIYGQVIRIGGKDPAVRLGLDDDSEITIKIDKELARELASFLYRRIGLTGTAEWDVENRTIVSFTNPVLIDYQETTLSESFKNIASIIGDSWKDVDVIKAIAELREEELDDSLP